MNSDSKKNANPILKGLSEVMKQEGFKKKASNWYMNTKETILVVNLQSEYKRFKFINFGIWIKTLADDEYISQLASYGVNIEYPQEHHCHIRFRLRAALPKDKWDICEELEDTKNIKYSGEERKAMIKELIEKFCMPMLKQCSTIEGIKKALNEDIFKGALIYWKVKELS